MDTNPRVSSLLTLSGFFSSAETAMVSVSKIRLRTLEEEGNKKAALALKILEKSIKNVERNTYWK